MHGIGADQPLRTAERHGAQVAADIGGRQAKAAQSGNHDMGEVLAHAAAQRERHRRRGGHRGGADLIGEVGLDPLHQFDRAFEHRSAGRKALARIVADFGIERDLAAGEQVVRRRPSTDVVDRECRVAHLLPGRRRADIHRGEVLHGHARDQLDDQFFVRAIEPDPGEMIAEEVIALAALRRHRIDLQGGRMHPLPHAIDRRQPQHVVRIGDRRRIGIDRGLAQIVDHASASHCGPDRSL